VILVGRRLAGFVGIEKRLALRNTLETFVRQYIEAQPEPIVTFAWQGGEPTLLRLEFCPR
jgi:sulfatase maturation enzyme AslB (radical SAM superfamily)